MECPHVIKLKIVWFITFRKKLGETLLQGNFRQDYTKYYTSFCGHL